MNLFNGCEGRKLNNGLTWLNEPPDWRFNKQGKLTIIPKPVSDFFRPYQENPNDNACLLYRKVSGDFTVVTRARATLIGFGDAAAITVRASAVLWAKLCLERSPIGDVSAVSVVTNQWSDDANGELLDRPESFLRITRRGDLFGMHYSRDGSSWRFVRSFGLKLPPEVMVGVHAQAPFQGGCTAEFDFLKFIPAAVTDFRSGE